MGEVMIYTRGHHVVVVAIICRRAVVITIIVIIGITFIVAIINFYSAIIIIAGRDTVIIIKVEGRCHWSGGRCNWDTLICTTVSIGYRVIIGHYFVVVIIYGGIVKERRFKTF
jgi:hypothetical protein